MENTVFIIHQLYLFCHSTAGSELRAQGLASRAGSPHGPAGERPGRAAPQPPHLTPPQIFPLTGRERQRRGARGPAPRPGTAEGAAGQFLDVQRDAGSASPRPPPLAGALPPPLSLSGDLGEPSTQAGEAEGGRVPADSLEVEQARRDRWSSLCAQTAPRGQTDAQGPGRAGPDLRWKPRGPRRRRRQLRAPRSTRFARVALAPLPPPPPPRRLGSIPFVRIYGERLQ